jgi:hypothetical protein
LQCQNDTLLKNGDERMNADLDKRTQDYREQMLVQWYLESLNPLPEDIPLHAGEFYVGLGAGSVVWALEKAGWIEYTTSNYYRLTDSGLEMAKSLRPKWENNLPPFEDTEP